MTSTSRRSWQEGSRDAASLPEVLHALRGRLLLVVGAVLVLGGIALLLGLFREPAYTAEAEVTFAPQEPLEDENARKALAQEVVAGVTAPRAFSGTVRSGAGWEGTSEEFRNRLDAGAFLAQDGGMGLRVAFTGRDQDEAARVANTYARLFASGVENLGEGQISGGTPVGDARVARRAERPSESGPRPLLYAAVAAGAGLLIGGFFALFLEGRAGGWRGVRDAEVTLRAPVLGAIPDYSTAEDEG